MKALTLCGQDEYKVPGLGLGTHDGVSEFGGEMELSAEAHPDCGS